MAIGTQQTSQTYTASDDGQSYRGPLAMVTTLFFMWGFLTCLNDILIPHLKSIFDLNYAQVMLVQMAFFGAYAVFSIPSGLITERVGYKRMMVAGLLTMAVGALLFIPAANVPSFPLFLTALIILAAGITVLQVAANPYVALLGPAKSASARLTLTQAFNSFGTEDRCRNCQNAAGGASGLPHRASVVGQAALHGHRRSTCRARHRDRHVQVAPYSRR